MKEQSHKDEMSAALRGDFERLRGRGVPTTLAPPDEPEQVPDVCQPDEQAPQPIADDEPVPRGWRARFFG